MVVKLFGQIKAGNPQRVLLCFLEKGIEFEVIHVDLNTFEQKKPEYLLRQVINSFNYSEKTSLII